MNMLQKPRSQFAKPFTTNVPGYGGTSRKTARRKQKSEGLCKSDSEQWGLLPTITCKKWLAEY